MAAVKQEMEALREAKVVTNTPFPFSDEKLPNTAAIPIPFEIPAQPNPDHKADQNPQKTYDRSFWTEGGERSLLNLVMIVRDEQDTIAKVLDNLLPYIDSATIVDTGSIDNTKQVIRQFFENHAGIPCDLYDRKWVDFATNRTEALSLAAWAGRSYYNLMFDADELIQGHPPIRRVLQETVRQMQSPQNHTFIAGFYLRFYGNGEEFWREAIFINDGKTWRYEGEMHEAPVMSVVIDAKCPKMLSLPSDSDDYWYIDVSNPDLVGARSKNPRKFHQDAIRMDAVLDKDPSKPRSWFYAAEMHYFAAMELKDKGDAKDRDDHFNKAIDRYIKRISVGMKDKGFMEEVYMSYMRLAVIHMTREQPTMAIDFYRKAYDFWYAWHNYKSIRMEPVSGELAALLTLNEKDSGAHLKEAHQVAQRKVIDVLRSGGISVPETLFLLNRATYDHGVIDLACRVCLLSGDLANAAYLSNHILQHSALATSALLARHEQYMQQIQRKENASHYNVLFRPLKDALKTDWITLTVGLAFTVAACYLVSID